MLKDVLVEKPGQRQMSEGQINVVHGLGSGSHGRRPAGPRSLCTRRPKSQKRSDFPGFPRCATQAQRLQLSQPAAAGWRRGNPRPDGPRRVDDGPATRRHGTTSDGRGEGGPDGDAVSHSVALLSVRAAVAAHGDRRPNPTYGTVPPDASRCKQQTRRVDSSPLGYGRCFFSLERRLSLLLLEDALFFVSHPRCCCSPGFDPPPYLWTPDALAAVIVIKAIVPASQAVSAPLLTSPPCRTGCLDGDDDGRC